MTDKLTPQVTEENLAAAAKNQIFDNPSDRRLVWGYICGLVSALCLGFSALSEMGGGSPTVITMLSVVGLVFLMPALWWSFFWRVIATFVALILGVKFGLELKLAVSHYGMIKTVADAAAKTVETRYGVMDIVSPTLSCMVCIAFSAFVSFFDLKDAKESRNFSVVFNGVLTVGLAVLIWLMCNYLVSQRPTTFDWTGSQLYTLSSESTTFLKTAKKRMTMHIFMSKSSDRFAVIKQLARQYQESLEGLLEVKELDPFKDRFKFESELARLDVIGTDLSDLTGVVFEVGHYESQSKNGETKDVWVKDRSKQISTRDMFQVRYRAGKSRPIFNGEELFTNAILELQGEKRSKIYFLTGHNEHSFTDKTNSQACGKVIDFLGKRFFDVAPLMLSAKQSIPDDCSVLVIAGARGDFSSSDLAELRTYLSRGGRLMAYLEVIPSGDDGLKPSALTSVLQDYNIVPSRHLIIGRVGVQKANKIAYYPTTENVRFPAFDVNHPIVKPLLGSHLISTEARALTIGKKNPSVKAVSLVNGGGKFDTIAVKRPADFKRRGYQLKKDEDMRADFSLAIASELVQDKAGKKQRTRVIAVGDSDLMTNGGLGRGKNIEFFLNGLNWLLEKEGRFVSKAKVPPTWSLDIDPGTKIILKMGALFILPIFPLSIGLLMFLIRRR
jgi:hypothetical protein